MRVGASIADADIRCHGDPEYAMSKYENQEGVRQRHSGESGQVGRLGLGEGHSESGLGMEPKERCPFLCRLRWRPDRVGPAFPRSRSIHCDELSGESGSGEGRG
jgi:hypothetical protein